MEPYLNYAHGTLTTIMMPSPHGPLASMQTPEAKAAVAAAFAATPQELGTAAVKAADTQTQHPDQGF